LLGFQCGYLQNDFSHFIPPYFGDVPSGTTLHILIQMLSRNTRKEVMPNGASFIFSLAFIIHT
jgi:hypothetical protein